MEIDLEVGGSTFPQQTRERGLDANCLTLGANGFLTSLTDHLTTKQSMPYEHLCSGLMKPSETALKFASHSQRSDQYLIYNNFTLCTCYPGNLNNI